MNLQQFYARLLTRYGPQGWWPLLELRAKDGETLAKAGGSPGGYHRGDYSYPRTGQQRFEVCAGAILTQNTAWVNVEQALANLHSHGLLDPARIVRVKEERLRRLIRPAGYYNQKAKKLKAFARFYLALKGAVPSREELLRVWGVGPETADSIRLYAYGRLEFVVDAYTKRVLSGRKLVATEASYEEVKRFCVARLPRDVKLYQEFHALLVAHAKRQKGL
jgi:endonuclease-3 related protein